MNNPLKLKSFYTLKRPILTYGSEIWVTDYKIKENTLDNLPFEKIQNRFCKYLLGVHKKASNFAARLEFGRNRILNFINFQALKYVNRINELPSTRILREIFEVDKALNRVGYRSFYSSYQKSMSDFNFKDLDDIVFPQIIHHKSVEEVSAQLRSVKDANKLYTYS